MTDSCPRCRGTGVTDSETGVETVPESVSAVECPECEERETPCDCRDGGHDCGDGIHCLCGGVMPRARG